MDFVGLGYLDADVKNRVRLTAVLFTLAKSGTPAGFYLNFLVVFGIKLSPIFCTYLIK